VNYRDALAWLYRTQTFGIKPGLESTHLLLAALGQPQQRLRFLHLAGTNGKGSTCAMLDTMLRANGIRCGLYTSPHLFEFRERIRVDAIMIPEEAVAEGLTCLREAVESWDQPPTFFELATALAAWWFDKERVDLVVWETGLGGRLDATNAISPLVSIITPIDWDHQAWLGSTLAEIAAEKAGIIKPGVPVVSAPQVEEVRAVLWAHATSAGTVIDFVEEPWNHGPLALAGVHQRWNASVAWAALKAIGVEIAQPITRASLATLSWPGRFQRLGRDLVVDGAHNPQAVQALVDTWREVFGDVKAHLIFGVLEDKEAEKLLRLLRIIADEVWLVPLSSSRGVPAEELLSLAGESGFASVRVGPMEKALAEARAGAFPVLVAGSLFLAGEVLALLSGESRPEVSSQ